MNYLKFAELSGTFLPPSGFYLKSPIAQRLSHTHHSPVTTALVDAMVVPLKEANPRSYLRKRIWYNSYCLTVMQIANRPLRCSFFNEKSKNSCLKVLAQKHA